MKLRLFSLPLAALTMAALFLLCALPTTADDGAVDAETVYTETEQIELDTSSLSDNDTLLEDYVEQLFSLNSGIALSSYGEDYLSGVDLDVYTQLKAAIESIAAGEESSSIVTVSLQYTPDELDAANYDSAYEAFYAQLNRTHVLNYLLYDCPYDFYWFDKSANTTSQLRCTETQEVLTVTITYYFPVAEGYQSETKYTVNSEKAAAAMQSAANALAIVEEYDSLSDSEKLSAYKDEICALTSYNKDYATASYGDIWQLVWVFDGDEDTNVVCEGYSKAFQYLCDLSSFDDVLCYTVIGTMNGGTGAGNHMWNVVCLNSVTYMADITNSDSGTIGKNGGLFMVCADDAVSSSSSGYSFLVGSTTIRYIYNSTSLELYGADVLTLGSTAEQSGGSTETGTCGENVIWTLDTSTGVLTISGEGEMEDYSSSSDVPWYSLRESITAVVIEDGVTSIGSFAFYECSSLTDVYYGGSEDDWNTITIGSDNDPLTSATIHYNSTGPEDADDTDDDTSGDSSGGTDSTTPGDLNGDGEVNASDLTILARHVGKVETIEDETCLANADVTGDGDVDASDLTKLAQYVGKIISSLE
ncbi:MAG: dockerin type I domain-containing protein [Oscillospiraceae bacterium]|nr:dockerin type I domain-containing protein [Oscillospiraceae bacterium]